MADSKVKLSKEVDKILAEEKLVDKLSKRNKGTSYKAPSYKYVTERAKKEGRKKTDKEKQRLDRQHAREVIKEESKADYSWMQNPYKKKKILGDDEPGENRKYLDKKNATSTEGSFKKGGLVIKGKPKLCKKGWK